jgi:hypothetical protein
MQAHPSSVQLKSAKGWAKTTGNNDNGVASINYTIEVHGRHGQWKCKIFRRDPIVFSRFSRLVLFPGDGLVMRAPVVARDLSPLRGLGPFWRLTHS